jgi:O-antigen chain-terminating methyltransferase
MRDRASREETVAAVAAGMQVSIADLHAEVEALTAALRAMEERVEAQQAVAARARSRIDALAAGISSSPSGGSSSATVDATATARASAFDEIYTAFEEQFRGPREVVQELQRPYLDLIDATGHDDLPVIDIGPGRGEWLELLGKIGARAYGIDLNADMAAAGQEHGVDVRQGDAMAHLAELEEGSVRAVTGFHFIEHIAFDDQLSFLRLAARALAPGGALILETPNPTNLVVGASSFYLDPTHLRPVHPQLLEFLVRSQGFSEVEVRYLHPSTSEPETFDGLEPAGIDAMVRWALYGPQDYAVVARKGAEPAG